jgi:KDO2-lipid IV(A) lauroyltransferase
MALIDGALAGLLRTVFALLRLLGPVRASNLGGAVARGIGPYLPVSKVADANLRRALPDLDAAGRAEVVRQVWDNLGRTVCELPNMDRIVRNTRAPGFELVIHPESADFTTDRGAIYVAGHLGNWEVLVSVSRALRPDFGLFYRAAANRAVDQVIRTLRARGGPITMRQFAKGARGGREGVRHLRAGGAVGMLVDQKANDGIASPFFGQMAMTAPSAAALALRYRLRLMPTRVERLGPAWLRVTIEKPIALPDTGNLEADTATLTDTINTRLESWIRDRPGDWLWLHRRWPKEQ